MVFRVSFLPFWLEATVKNNTWNERDFRHGYGNYFKSAVLNVTWFQLCSKFFLNYEAHWQWHLEVTLQLKNLGTWPNKHANSFLGKYHEIKMGEGVLQIISYTKIQVCPFKNIAPWHFTYYCIFLCLSNKPSS